MLIGVQDETTKTVVARSNGTVACLQGTDSGNVWRRALAKVTVTSDMQVSDYGHPVNPTCNIHSIRSHSLITWPTFCHQFCNKDAKWPLREFNLLLKGR